MMVQLFADLVNLSTMLPVNSATTRCSKVGIHGGFSFNSVEHLKLQNGHHHISRRQQVSCFSSVTYGSHNGFHQVSVIDDAKKGTSLSVDSSMKDFIIQKLDGDDSEIIPGLEISPSPDGIVSGAKDFVNSKLESISLSIKASFADVNKAFDDAISEIALFVNKSGESAGNKLTGFTAEYKEKSGIAGRATLDALRNAIVVVESLLLQGARLVVYSYGYAKTVLPVELQDAVRSSEGDLEKVLNPIGTSLQQVYTALEGLEEYLGLDPNDPLIHFILFFGLSTTIWSVYRVSKYGGYSGDLTPKSTFELLQGNGNAVLIDIRPEDARERDGIPDLRRKARFRYASVTLPEVDGSVRKLLRGNRDVEDSLLAAVIQNLKIVDDRSKVLVMDSDGIRLSKGVARSLRKLGIKKAYLVQGGFKSWVEDGFRIKMLKTDTALTVITEEAEAILEEIKPTPLKLVGYGLAAVAVAYTLIEWEKTLQFVGVIGLFQTIYRRVSSYENAADFGQDLRLLLEPVRIGVEAISRTSEVGRNGLPTSPPSSSDVQARVLQAAAKHESQPEEEDSPPESSVNMSEAA